MSSIIQPSYGPKAYGVPTKARGTKQTETKGSSFLDLAARASRDKSDVLDISGKVQDVTDSQAQAVSDNEALEKFKKDIWSEIDSMSWGSSISVQITDDAFEKMMVDKEFKNKMMNLIREDACGSNAMCGGTIIRIDGNGYSGYSYMDNHAAFGRAAVETHSKGKSAFYSKKIDKKRQDERLLQRKRDMERTAKAAADRHDARVRIAKADKSFSSIADLLKTRIASTPSATLETFLPAGTDMPFFKKEFYEDLSKIICNPTVSNAAVNISDAAFQAMKDDPEYRAQVLALLQRDLGASYAPRNCSVLITVGTSLDQYRADSWPVGNDSEFHTRSKGSFWEQRMERHKKYMELAEEAAAKRRLMMKLRMNGGSVSAAELLMGLL